MSNYFKKCYNEISDLCMKKLNLYFIYLASFLYMELLAKLLLNNTILSMSLVNLFVFLILFSLFITIISRLFRERGNKITLIVILSLVAIWFSAEYVVKDYFDFYLSLSTFKVADQVRGFMGKIVIETLKRLPGIILFFLPLILSLIFSKRIDFSRVSKKELIFLIILLPLFYGVYLLTLNINKDKAYSNYNLYYKINDISLNIDNFGIINSFTIDVKRALFGFEEKIVLDSYPSTKEEEEEKTYEYNILDIDFSSLEEKETDSTIKTMHEYFASDTGTLKNEYTGIFAGKNLILFMAESFNEIAVRSDLTPTLYKLVNSGFSFQNFYTPTIYSTIGGEFQELTGLYASGTDILSKFRSGKITFPQGIATKFQELDYKTFAYHNNSYVFQDRNKYLASLGFTNFLACYNGLEKLINCKTWPQSDVEMIKATMDDYINEDNFMVFYATVSGHAGYTWSNASSQKNKEEYLAYNLNYSEGPASYLAAQMELDKALEVLINALDEKGILQDTVIALVGDHYPYELTMDEVNEISTFTRDSVVSVNKSSFILWNSEMDTVVVDKVGSQIDVMPTIYNAFGIDYDSRLFIGKDILSTEPGLAIFANSSWVSDKGIYYTKTKEFVPFAGATFEDDYVSKMNQIVRNKITMSKNIINYDYYNLLFN